MEEQYKVLLEQHGSFKQGDIAAGRLLASGELGLQYLLKIGAIEPAVNKESPAKTTKDTK